MGIEVRVAHLILLRNTLILIAVFLADKSATEKHGKGFDSHILTKLKARYSKEHLVLMEQVMGIEPTCSAWKADILPLNYTRLAGLLSTDLDSITEKVYLVKCFFEFF